MFDWKKTGILIAGVFLSVFWVWFSNSVQKEQNLSKLESIQLRAEVAKNDLEKLFNYRALKNSKVNKPFLFSLKLDSQTLAPKNFKVRKKDHLNLSALRIKTSFKESGMKQAFFLHSYNHKKEESFIVRVRSNNGDLYLDGLPIDYMTNSLSYTFPTQSWYLLNASNKVLLSSNKTMVGQTFFAENDNSVRQSFAFSSQPSTLVVELQRPYSNALVTFSGVAGILIMTLSLLFMSGWAFNFSPRKNQAKTASPREDLGISGLTFEEEMTREIEGLTDDIEHMEMTPVEKVKPAAVSPSTSASTFGKKVSSPKPATEDVSSNENAESNKSSVSTKTEDLDYSDFLMENPVLGGADFIESSDENQEESVEEYQKLSESQSEDSDSEKSVKNTSFDDSEVEEKQAEDWLKLAEDLTANLDEFAKTFEKEKSPLNPHRKTEKDSQI